MPAISLLNYQLHVSFGDRIPVVSWTIGLCDLIAMFAYNSRESRVTSAKDMADDNGVNVVEFVWPERII